MARRRRELGRRRRVQPSEVPVQSQPTWLDGSAERSSPCLNEGPMPRTHAAAVVHRPEEIVTVRGWVDAKRDHGKITFFDLRDHTGIVQCVGRGGQVGTLRNEDVIEVVGKVSRRPAKMESPHLATGLYEIGV